MTSRIFGVRTLVRGSLVVVALVATSMVPLSAFAEAAAVDLTAPTALTELISRPKAGEITITRGLS